MRTPTTLKEALSNGLVQACTPSLNQVQLKRLHQLTPEAQKLAAEEFRERQIATIERHVVDFFRQKFCVAYIQLTEWSEDPQRGKDPGEIIRLLAASTGVSKNHD